MKLFKVVVILLCLVCAVLITLSLRNMEHGLHAAHDAFVEEVASARRAGLPVDPKDLQAPLPPPQQNAAPIYTQLGLLLKTKPLSLADKAIEPSSFYSAPLTPEQVQKARQALQHRSDLVALIHKVVGYPDCVFVRDWSVPMNVPFPEFSTMREAARILATESVVMAWDGKPLEAVRNQALGFQIARHAATENELIGYLVANAVHSLTLSGMQRILYRSGNDSAVADAVQWAIETSYHPFSTAQALHSEIASSIGDLRYLRKQGPGGFSSFAGTAAPATPLKMNANAWNNFMDTNETVLLRRLRRAIDVANRPFLKAYPLLKAIDDEVDNGNPQQDMISSIMLPGLENLAVSRAANQARAEVTLAGAALLTWKARHGNFPAELSTAMPTVPVDPFDGKPLRYRREGAGFVVYCVGEDGTFNGGTPNKKPDNHEVFFRYPQPVYPK